MKIKFFSFTLIIFFIFVFFVFYKGLKSYNIYEPILNSKQDIPKFFSKTLNESQIINSEDLFKQDKLYIFNIWASWCIPCRDEHPLLMNLSKSKKIDVIGLNYKDNIKNAKKFIFELGNPYSLILQDKDGTLAIEWGAFGVPETYIIYKNQIIKKYIGPLNLQKTNDIKNLIK